MALSKSKLATNNKHLAEKYEIVSIRTRKSDRINEQIELAARMKNTSKRQYVLAAIKKKLDADGITIESLPPADKND